MKTLVDRIPLVLNKFYRPQQMFSPNEVTSPDINQTSRHTNTCVSPPNFNVKLILILFLI